ncbi:ATP-binding protein [Myxococcota bacterium]|nr:ATP-binding protein [Myxococcota bacterium]
MEATTAFVPKGTDLDRLRALAIDSVTDAVVITTVTGVVVDLNPAFTSITGWGPELLGRDGIVLLDERSRDPELLRAIVDTALSNGCWTGELTYRHRAGHTYLGRASVAPLALGRSGTTHFVSLHRDITAFRRTADVERQAAMNIQQLIARLPDAIAVLKGDTLVFANDAMEELVGAQSSARLAGRRLLDFIVPKDTAKVQDVLQRARRDDTPPDRVEVRLARLDERIIQVELQALRVSFDASPAVAVVARDLSALKQIDLRAREMDRMVAIGTLAAGIAHEINTPIQYIGDSAFFLQESYASLSKLLERYRALSNSLATDDAARAELEALQVFEQEIDAEYLEREVPAALRRTLDGTERVARIVRAMKEFGHPGSDTPAPTDLDELVQNVLVVATNEIKYVADAAVDLGGVGHVTCFAGAVNQVLLNLIVNAAHAVADKMAKTKERGRITVRTRVEGTMVHVSIADTGTGIPPDVQPRVFDPFFTTKPVGKGTGQGLAIARSIVVDRHGGRIWFDTEPGVGTTFHFVIPVEPTADLGGGATS